MTLAPIDAQLLPVGHEYPETPDEYASIITTTWRSTVIGILGTGYWILRAKEDLPHGEFTGMVETSLPFSTRTAQRLMAIALNPILGNPTHVSHLPPSWGALYELTKLPVQVLTKLLEDGQIGPETERSDIRRLLDEGSTRGLASEDKPKSQGRYVWELIERDLDTGRRTIIPLLRLTGKEREQAIEDEPLLKSLISEAMRKLNGKGPRKSRRED